MLVHQQAAKTQKRGQRDAIDGTDDLDVLYIGGDSYSQTFSMHSHTRLEL